MFTLISVYLAFTEMSNKPQAYAFYPVLDVDSDSEEHFLEPGTLFNRRNSRRYGSLKALRFTALLLVLLMYSCTAQCGEQSMQPMSCLTLTD